MPTSFKQVFINFSLVSLFVFSTISFIVVFGVENGAINSILDNPTINSTFGNLSSDMGEQLDNSTNASTAFNAETPAPGFGSLIIFAIVGVTKGFTSVIVVSYHTIIILPMTFLGIPSSVAQVLGSILMMVLIFLAWRVYRVGS